MQKSAPSLRHTCFLETDLASTLRKARAALSWSRRDLATISGVSVRTIAAIEAGETEGRVTTLKALVRTLEKHDVEVWKDDAGRVLVTTRCERTLSRAERRAELQVVA